MSDKIILTLTEDQKALYKILIPEGDDLKYCEAKNDYFKAIKKPFGSEGGFLKRIKDGINQRNISTRHKKSVKTKHGWRKFRTNFMAGMKKYYRGLSGHARTQMFKGSLSTSREKAKLSETSISPVSEDMDEHIEKTILLPILPYQDFKLIQEIAGMIEYVSEQSRTFTIEESYSERADVGTTLIEALATLISCIAQRDGDYIEVPQDTLTIVWDALNT